MQNNKQSRGKSLLHRFIDIFFDSERRSIEDEYLEKARKRNPELARKFNSINKTLNDVSKFLDSIEEDQKKGSRVETKEEVKNSYLENLQERNRRR